MVQQEHLGPENEHSPPPESGRTDVTVSDIIVNGGERATRGSRQESDGVPMIVPIVAIGGRKKCERSDELDVARSTFCRFAKGRGGEGVRGRKTEPWICVIASRPVRPRRHPDFATRSRTSLAASKLDSQTAYTCREACTRVRIALDQIAFSRFIVVRASRTLDRARH